MGSQKDYMPKRSYHGTDAELIQTSDQLLDTATRDQNEFIDYGFTPERLSAIQGLREEYSNIETDIEMSSDITDATFTRNEKRSDLETALRSLGTRLENKGDFSIGFMNKVTIPSMTKISDDQLVRSGKQVVKNVATKLDVLAEVGITEVYLNGISDKITLFDQAIDDKVAAELAREVKTAERIEKGNQLYAELVKLANTGKDIWYTVNEAKYNDYLLIEKHSQPKEEE